MRSWRALAGCAVLTLLSAGQPVRSALAAPEPGLPVSAGAGNYHAQAPARILDSRNAGDAWAHLGPGQGIEIPLLGRGGVPASGVGAVALNLTLTNATTGGSLTVWPAGTAMPVASAVEFLARATISRLSTVTLGSGGRIALHNDRGQVDLIADVEGWFGSPAPGPAGAGLYNGLMPARLLDTRYGIGGRSAPLAGGEVFNLAVAGLANVPATGAGAAVLELTAAGPGAGGYLEAWPAGAARPTGSNLNYYPGQTLSNRAIVPLGSGGMVSVYASGGPVPLIVDVEGWFSDGAAATAGGTYTPLRPARLLDTRTGAGPVAQGALLNVQASGAGGVPAGAGGVAVQVTVVAAASPGYLGVFPAGNAPPLASDLSVQAGITAGNVALTRLSSQGALTVFNAGGAAQIVVDVLGWFAAAPVPGRLPSAPTITGGSAASPFSVNLAWSPPADPGGTTVTSYSISPAPDGIYAPVFGSATSGVVGGLACGITHTFTIVAINALGSGAVSAPIQVATTCSNIIGDVPYYRQVHELSCEEAALQMALAHEGIYASQDQELNDLVIDWRHSYYDSNGLRWGDAYTNFVGDPDGSEVLLTGYGVYWSDIGRIAALYGARVLVQGENISPATVYDSILHNHPVVAWVTFDWRYHSPGSYLAFDGRGIPYSGAVEHAVTLVGVTPDSVLVDNPWTGQQWISKATFEASFATYHYMAVVLD